MNNTRFLQVAWALCALLVASSVLLKLTANPTETRPDADGTGPNEARMFADLLRASKYQVRVDRSNRPVIEPDEIPIAFVPNEDRRTREILAEPDAIDETLSLIQDHLEKKGKAIILPYDKTFSKDSQESSAAIGNKTYKIQTPYTQFPSLTGLIPVETAVMWNSSVPSRAPSPASFLIGNDESKKGEILVSSFSNAVTNRFLAKSENHKLILHEVGLIAKPGSKLVFLESSWGNGEDIGLLATIGPWALAAWRQMLVLFIVMIWTLGKPFGLANVFRRSEDGSLERVDAVSNLLGKAQETRLALQSGYRDADYLVRRKLRISSEATVSDRNRMLPPALISALTEVEKHVNGEKISSPEAFKLLKNLDSEAKKFIDS